MTAKRITTDRLVGVAEIAELVGVPKTNITTLMSRRESNGFPEPVAQLRMGGVFDRLEVVKWAQARGLLAQPQPESATADAAAGQLVDA